MSLFCRILMNCLLTSIPAPLVLLRSICCESLAEEKLVVNPVSWNIIERTNKQTHDQRKLNPLYLHTGFRNFIIFPVVVTTAEVHTKKREFYQKLNNKTTNCRWNNFYNVVRSLNIICMKRWKLLGELDSGIVPTSFGLCNMRTD